MIQNNFELAKVDHIWKEILNACFVKSDDTREYQDYHTHGGGLIRVWNDSDLIKNDGKNNAFEEYDDRKWEVLTPQQVWIEKEYGEYV